jgi:hypothetical protein
MKGPNPVTAGSVGRASAQDLSVPGRAQAQAQGRPWAQAQVQAGTGTSAETDWGLALLELVLAPVWPCRRLATGV